MEYLSIVDNDRILIVAPHPDDECIGAGGLLSLYPKQCYVLVLTDGRIGQANHLPCETISIRRQELSKELDGLGVEYETMNKEDGKLSNSLNLLDNFDLSSFSKIFIPGLMDGHPDHAATYVIVKNAISKQNIGADVFLYEVHKPLVNPSHFLDISGVIDKKIELIRCHDSQICIAPYDDMARSLAEYRALQNRLRDAYMEAYELDKGVEADDSFWTMENEIQKQRLFYKVMTRWLELNHSGWSLGEEIKRRGFRTVCIYGYAELGKLACTEIEEESALVLQYVFDKKVGNKPQIDGIRRIYSPNFYFNEVDCVIVTAFFHYQEIFDELKQKGYKNILSLEEIIEYA